jgi:hypothetical protein
MNIITTKKIVQIITNVISGGSLIDTKLQWIVNSSNYKDVPNIYKDQVDIITACYAVYTGDSILRYSLQNTLINQRKDYGGECKPLIEYFVERFTNDINTIYDKSIVLLQYELAQKCSEIAKVSICTCGNCGDVILIDKTLKLDEITCLSCGFTEEECHFPDLFCV